MANQYYQQAAREIDAQINAGKAINADARSQTNAEYARYLAALDSQAANNKGAFEGQATQDRARMANRLAARGLGVDGAVQFNYGRLNSEHEGQLSALLRDALAKRGDLLGAQAKAVGGIDAQDRALMLQREGKIGELARLLEDRAWQRAQQEREYQLRASAQAFARRQAEAAANPQMTETQFLEGLVQEGERTGWKSLAPLARYARVYDRDLNDYYYGSGSKAQVIPKSLLDAARARRGGGGASANNLLSALGVGRSGGRATTPAPSRAAQAAEWATYNQPNGSLLNWLNSGSRWLFGNDDFQNPTDWYWDENGGYENSFGGTYGR